MKIKRVSLEMIAKLQPDYANADGVYKPDTDTIYIDAKLPVAAVPSASAVLAHEKAHALLHKHNLAPAFPHRYEEMFCELYALATAPAATMTSIEALSAKLIFRGLTWTKKADRQAIIEKILVLCQVQPNRELISKLSGVV